jgi:hypothetical protein
MIRCVFDIGRYFRSSQFRAACSRSLIVRDAKKLDSVWIELSIFDRVCSCWVCFHPFAIVSYISIMTGAFQMIGGITGQYPGEYGTRYSPLMQQSLSEILRSCVPVFFSSSRAGVVRSSRGIAVSDGRYNDENQRYISRDCSMRKCGH